MARRTRRGHPARSSAPHLRLNREWHSCPTGTRPPTRSSRSTWTSDYPNVPTDLNRWLPLVKWLLAIPHYIVLAFLGIAVLGAVIGAWFAVLLTGRYPRGIFDFVEGVLRWALRVDADAFLLVTDRYPPFSLS
jgi:hypothetical protein